MVCGTVGCLNARQNDKSLFCQFCAEQYRRRAMNLPDELIETPIGAARQLDIAGRTVRPARRKS